ILVASTARDLFLYKTYANTTPSTPSRLPSYKDRDDADPAFSNHRSAEEFLGTDTIHNFHIGQDGLVVVMAIDMNAWNQSGVGGTDHTFVSNEGRGRHGTTSQWWVNAEEGGWSLETVNANLGNYVLHFDSTKYNWANFGNEEGEFSKGDFSITLLG